MFCYIEKIVIELDSSHVPKSSVDTPCLALGALSLAQAKETRRSLEAAGQSHAVCRQDGCPVQTAEGAIMAVLVDGQHE